MGKKRHHKQQKTTRKHDHHTHDASLPFIEASPNLKNTPVPYLPKIIVDCDMHISRRHLKKIQRYLRFADPHDLRHLTVIRIVEPSALTFPSKTSAAGCYWPKWKHRSPEIWLSTRLFMFPGLKQACINRVILREDRLFETLFHELGHHKAHTIRLVSKHKQEAYAEKYMQAYTQVWQHRQRWRRLAEKIIQGLLSLVGNRYVMMIYFFTIRKRNVTTQRLYQIYRQYARRQISQEELWEHIASLGPQRSHTQEKKGWVHPLHQAAYREKFGLDERHDDAQS